MKIEDTKVSIAGVFRCCIHSLSEAFTDGEEVELGDRHECPHCGAFMELRMQDDEPTWVAVLDED